MTKPNLNSNLNSPTSTKPAAPLAPASTALGVIVIPAPGSQAGRVYRGSITFTLSLTASILFILALGRLGIGMEGLPWYICITACAILSARSLNLTPAAASFTEYSPGYLKETVNLGETLSVSFLAIAILLFILAAQPLAEKQPARKLEAVDIQLLSIADSENNQAYLPGQQEQNKIRKRTGETRSVQGELAPPPTPVIARPVTKAPAPAKNTRKQTIAARISQTADPATGKALSGKPEQKPDHKPEPKIVEAKVNATIPVSMPSGWFTREHRPVPAEKMPRPALDKTSPAPAQAYFTEVSPPEMVELTDNNGDLDTMHIFQSGGISSGGTGAQNELSQYLKELNKQIKSAWNPPRGQNHKLVVLFRIQQSSGRLSFAKISSTSGDTTTDRSALLAVMHAVNRCRFPKSFTAPYLDISYTFLYNFDELQELQKQTK